MKPHDPYAAFRHRPYRVYFVLNFINVIGSQMVAAAVGWQIYAHTHQALALAMVGLAMAVPHYLLFLPAGDKVDRGTAAISSLSPNAPFSCPPSSWGGRTGGWRTPRGGSPSAPISP